MTSPNRIARPPHETANDAALSVRNLRTYFYTPAGVVKAVDDVSFDLSRSDILAIVGESGCGKSVTGLSIMKLIPVPPGRYVAGTVALDGTDLMPLNDHQMQSFRGQRVAMIFQNPRASLNPSFTVRAQMIETLRRHDASLSKSQAEDHLIAMLREAGFPDPERVAASYPHQLSGGMCQRVSFALSMACKPDILIADEPTTALDVLVQATILLLLKRAHEERGLAIILITHDFGVVRAMATRVIVMYAGKIQEQGPAETVLANAQHPYTKALIESVPNPDEPKQRLYQIPGQPPDLSRLPQGCRFAERCSSVMPVCRSRDPQLLPTPSGSLARCHLFASELEHQT